MGGGVRERTTVTRPKSIGRWQPSAALHSVTTKNPTTFTLHTPRTHTLSSAAELYSGRGRSAASRQPSSSAINTSSLSSYRYRTPLTTSVAPTTTTNVGRNNVWRSYSVDSSIHRMTYNDYRASDHLMSSSVHGALPGGAARRRVSRSPFGATPVPMRTYFAFGARTSTPKHSTTGGDTDAQTTNLYKTLDLVTSDSPLVKQASVSDARVTAAAKTVAQLLKETQQRQRRRAAMEEDSADEKHQQQYWDTTATTRGHAMVSPSNYELQNRRLMQPFHYDYCRAGDKPNSRVEVPSPTKVRPLTLRTFDRPSYTNLAGNLSASASYKRDLAGSDTTGTSAGSRGALHQEILEASRRHPNNNLGPDRTPTVTVTNAHSSIIPDMPVNFAETRPLTPFQEHDPTGKIKELEEELSRMRRELESKQESKVRLQSDLAQARREALELQQRNADWSAANAMRIREPLSIIERIKATSTELVDGSSRGQNGDAGEDEIASLQYMKAKMENDMAELQKTMEKALSELKS